LIGLDKKLINYLLFFDGITVFMVIYDYITILKPRQALKTRFRAIGGEHENEMYNCPCPSNKPYCLATGDTGICVKCLGDSEDCKKLENHLIPDGQYRSAGNCR